MTVRDIVLGVDLDEVVYEYSEGLRRELTNSGISTPVGEPITYSMSESGWFSTQDEFRDFHGNAVDTGLYERLELIVNASEILWDLSDAGYQINIITSRFVNPGQHKKVVAQTVKALDRDRIPYSNISFLDNKVLQNAHAYIDDSPINVNNLTVAGRFVIRKVMKYNVNDSGVPATTWAEIREILRGRFGR